MRKIISIEYLLSCMQRLLFMLVCLVCTNQVYAYDIKAANDDGVVIYYNIQGKNAIVTSGDEKYTGDVRIPATVICNEEPYSVVAIGNSAFLGCGALTSVVVPTSVTSIGNNAFFFCLSLKSIEIPSSVKSIGDDAFGYCDNLETVLFSEGLSNLGLHSFENCKKLLSVSIPASVTHIGPSAFIGNDGMTKISVEPGNPVYDSRGNCNAIIETSSNTLITGCRTTKIPNSITAIGNSAFYDCKTLTSIELPNSITTIGTFAFNHCSKLKKVVSVIREPFKITEDAFSDIPGGAVLYVPAGTKKAYKNVGGWNLLQITETRENISSADK